MVNLRCSKCGSDAGFLIETQDGRALEVPGELAQDRIKKTVRVTCTYCDYTWDHAPVHLVETSMDQAFGRHVVH